MSKQATSVTLSALLLDLCDRDLVILAFGEGRRLFSFDVDLPYLDAKMLSPLRFLFPANDQAVIPMNKGHELPFFNPRFCLFNRLKMLLSLLNDSARYALVFCPVVS